MRAVLIFFSGAFVTGLLFLFVFNGELRSKGEDAALIGVNHYYGEPARELSRGIGVEIPQDGVDCYYSIGGLKPVLEFVAFTVPKERLWPSVIALTGKDKSGASVPIHAIGPELFGEEYRTVLYDVSRIANPLVVDWRLNSDQLAECVVDEAAGRLFIFVTP